jgi:hypothetical protein
MDEVPSDTTLIHAPAAFTGKNVKKEFYGSGATPIALSKADSKPIAPIQEHAQGLVGHHEVASSVLKIAAQDSKSQLTLVQHHSLSTL